MKFCQTPLWDCKFSWYSDFPAFTPCFEDSVLALLPLLYWLVFTNRFLSKRKHLKRDIVNAWNSFTYTLQHQWKTELQRLLRDDWTVSLLPFTLIVISAYTFTFVLISVYSTFFVFSLGYASPATSLRFLANVFALVIAQLCQLCFHLSGRKISSRLFNFWFLFVLCSVPRCYRVLMDTFYGRPKTFLPATQLEFVVCSVELPFIVYQFLNCFMRQYSFKEGHKKSSPFEDIVPLSSVFFGWLTPIIWKGYKNPLTIKDLHSLPKEIKSKRHIATFTRLWNEEFDRNGTVSLLIPLLKMNWLPILLSVCLQNVRTIMKTMVPLSMNLIIDHINSDEPAWKGIIYAFSIFFLNVVSVTFDRSAGYISYTTGLKTKAILMSSIYCKALKLAPESQREYPVGRLVTLVSVDSEKLFRLSQRFPFVGALPINLILTFTLLWGYLGPSSMVGVGTIMVVTTVSVFLIRKSKALLASQMRLKDKRMKKISEILGSIRLLKLYAWEMPFTKRVDVIRNEEVHYLTKFVYLSAALGFFSTCTPMFVSMFCFFTYVSISPENVLTPANVFVSLTLFNSIRMIARMLPDFISECIQASVSLERIGKFLVSLEISSDNVQRNYDGENAVLMTDVVCSWGSGEADVVKNISLSLKEGQLMAVIGKVGSGKSSLLSALLGNLELRRGTVSVSGSVAYVPQDPWIQNASLRANILLTEKLNYTFYKKVLDSCCLVPDLEILPGKDLTEIGEKGINLSGGQKQRVSVARAVYQDKDIYLLDDPLSAVDAHVAARLFDDVFGPRGLLKEKSRILVTNNLSVLPAVDKIVVLKDGSIHEIGTYEELISKDGYLLSLLNEFLCSSTKEENTQVVPVSDRDSKRHRSGDKENTKEFRMIKDEKMETGRIRFKIYKTYVKSLGALYVALIICFNIAYRGFEIGSTVWLGDWSNDAELHETDNGYRIAVYTTLNFFQGLMIFLSSIVLTKSAIIASTKLHRSMLCSVVRAPVAFFDVTPIGRLLNRFSKDVDTLDLHLPRRTNMFLNVTSQIVGMIILTCSKLPLFAAVVFPLLGVYLYIQSIFLKSFRCMQRLDSVARSFVYSHFNESVSGKTIIRGFGVEDAFYLVFRRKIEVSQICSFHYTCSRDWLRLRLEMMSNTLNLSVSLLVVLSKGYLNAGDAAMLLSYALNSNMAFNQFVQNGSELESTLVAAERLDEYSSLKSEAYESTEGQPPAAWPQKGGIEFLKYSTRYRKNLDLVLKNINMNISPGEKVGIVGRTGAGKSSLILALFRIIERTEGKISIDDTDISLVGLDALRKKLTIIPQDPVLFNGTLRENLDPNDEYADEELFLALERAHVKGVFSEGLETYIEEGGANLSTGQRQLVCLARALIKRTKILLLDEATASVDLETDRLIQETIRKEFAECTTITIAHRIQTILDCDKVFVFKMGTISENGTPQELLSDQASEFHSLAKEASIVT